MGFKEVYNSILGREEIADETMTDKEFLDYIEDLDTNMGFYFQCDSYDKSYERSVSQEWLEDVMREQFGIMLTGMCLVARHTAHRYDDGREEHKIEVDTTDIVGMKDFEAEIKYMLDQKEE